MRKLSLIVLLTLAATIPALSQTLPQQLIEISKELKQLSVGFDEDLQKLETNLTDLRNDSTQTLERHSKRLADLESEADNSATSLTDLRGSLSAYKSYVRTALEEQSKRIRAQQAEMWVYRIAIAALVIKAIVDFFR